MSTRGKDGDPNYSAIVGRVPKKLKVEFRKHLLDLDLDVNEAVERLLRAVVSGRVSLEDLSPATDEVVSAAPAPQATARNLADVQGIDVSGWQPEDFERLRLRLGYNSPAELATELGINRTTWNRYEAGKSKPDKNIRRKLASLLAERDVSPPTPGDS